MPWYPAASDFLMTAQGFMNVAIWDMMGYAPNNTIVWADLISNQQNEYEVLGHGSGYVMGHIRR